MMHSPTRDYEYGLPDTEAVNSVFAQCYTYMQSLREIRRSLRYYTLPDDLQHLTEAEGFVEHVSQFCQTTLNPQPQRPPFPSFMEDPPSIPHGTVHAYAIWSPLFRLRRAAPRTHKRIAARQGLILYHHWRNKRRAWEHHAKRTQWKARYTDIGIYLVHEV